MPSGDTRFRSDIQALRGIAVLLVIVQHAREGLVQAGYLGVDIFFVVSGFLITGLVARGIADGSFRFGEFYFRRAKRLLPAAYLSFAATALLSALLLDVGEWRDFCRQLAGAVTFTANFVLWRQTGYFEGAAALKPLLHVWSLSVEEQYYLLAPASLVLLPKRLWAAGAGLVFAGSFALYLWLAPRDPSAAFYLLPTRAWELALGSLAALVPWRDDAKAWFAKLSPFGLLALVGLPLWSPGLPPMLRLPLVCLGTFLVVARTPPAEGDRPAVAAMARIGDASYSLYLVHWPIFALLNNYAIGDPAMGRPGDAILLAAVAAALLLGYLLYRHVELPVRNMALKPSRKLLLPALATSVLLATLPFAAGARTGAKDFVALRRDNLGFGQLCEGGREYAPRPECRNAKAPKLVVWGDSFAMALVPGLAATSHGGVLQATKSVCAPFLGLAQVTPDYPRDYAEGCIAFNDSVLKYLAKTPSVQVVALSSPFYPYFDPQRRLLLRVDGQLVERDPAQDTAIAAMRATVARLRAAGKRVVVVAPPPSTGVDMTHCIERRAEGSALTSHQTDCRIRVADYLASKAQVLEFLRRVETEADVPVLRFDPLLCDAQYCLTELDGAVLYRDEGHFSNEGSLAVARKMQLGKLVARSAR